MTDVFIIERAFVGFLIVQTLALMCAFSLGVAADDNQENWLRLLLFSGIFWFSALSWAAGNLT